MVEQKKFTCECGRGFDTAVDFSDHLIRQEGSTYITGCKKKGEK